MLFVIVGIISCGMLGYFFYEPVNARMKGRPWKLVVMGTLIVVFGCLITATLHEIVQSIYVHWIEQSSLVEAMLTGVASSFAGATYGLAVSTRAELLHTRELKSVLRYKASLDGDLEATRRRPPRQRIDMLFHLHGEYERVNKELEELGLKIDDFTDARKIYASGVPRKLAIAGFHYVPALNKRACVQRQSRRSVNAPGIELSS